LGLDQHHKSSTLPLIHVGHKHAKTRSLGVVAGHSKKYVQPMLIHSSVLRQNGHEDEWGNVVSSICVGLGAEGFDLCGDQFDHLESVDLGDNKMSFSDAAIFSALKMLNIYCNGIKSLHHPVSAFKYLEVLNLSFNIITADDLSPLFSIKSLVVLDLSFNMISRIPNRWHSLAFLKILSIEKNGLHHEDTFSYLSLAPSLQELNLNSNKLDCVPASCSAPGRFPQLTFISLVDNRFAHEKNVVALSYVPSIQQVDLWNNPMSSNSDARARSRHALKTSRSPSPEIQKKTQEQLPAADEAGFLRVMTPSNFECCEFSRSSYSRAPVLSFNTKPKRSLADIEVEARAVFKDGCESSFAARHGSFSICFTEWPHSITRNAALVALQPTCAS
jgi:Leucine-rich repeat (LRR) protein